MGRRKIIDSELQLEFDFGANDVGNELNVSGYEVVRPRENLLPRLPDNPYLDIYGQLEILFSQIGDVMKRHRLSLGSFILRSFYVEGKSVKEIWQQLTDGVAGLPSVSRERVRMIVSEIRDELLADVPTKKYTNGFRLRKDFLKELKECTEKQIGQVLAFPKYVNSPYLSSMAYLLHRKVVLGDTTIPWIKSQVFLIDETIERRVFNMHYLSLFYLLQKEVRPMSVETILQEIPNQKQWKGGEVNEDLIRLIFWHDEVFWKVDYEQFKLREEHLNVTQRIARIIYEEKDITPANIQRIYVERFGEKFSGLSIVGKSYPWCVLVGKSKWMYREDCQQQRMPSDIIHEYCLEHIRFTMDDVVGHLQSQGINIKESSIRCYILRDCRRLNSDGNVFCLTSEIKEEEDHLWLAKMNVSNRTRKKEWMDTLRKEIRNILEKVVGHRMLQKDVMHHCLPILDNEGIAYNNFYKVVNATPWVKVVDVDGKKYLELCD